MYKLAVMLDNQALSRVQRVSVALKLLRMEEGLHILDVQCLGLVFEF